MSELKIAKMIMKRRKERKMTQEDLANYLGVSKAAISKWETGQSYPDLALLPIIAAYFNLSVDELIGYEPQMDKNEIRSLYQRLCHDFTTQPFDEVITPCRDIVRRYYSCYPLLFQIGVLMINHSMLDPNQTQAINEWARSLFERVKVNSEDVDLAKQAQTFEALSYILLNQPLEALHLLEGCQKPMATGELLQAQAYQMMGEWEEAQKSTQIALYKGLMLMMEAFPMMLSLNDGAKFETVLQKLLEVVQTFELEGLNPYCLMPIYLLVAKKWMGLQEEERALDYLERYTKLATSIGSSFYLRASTFFSQLDQWYETFDLGKMAPRNEVIIKQSMIDAVVMEPLFMSLQTNERFIQLVKRLGE